MGDSDTAGRTDFPFYLALADRLGARAVADVGSGTGLLCSQLLTPGRHVLGIDPQQTMLDLAAAQPGAEGVEWRHGTAADLPADWADLVVMTGHVAQYFLDDEAWLTVLRNIHRALVAGGRVAFEIRNPAPEAWRAWARDVPVHTPVGMVRTEVGQLGDLVTSTSDFDQGDRSWTTTETLRFPSWATMTAGLAAAGFVIEDSWGDFDGGPITPDCPEWIILARADQSLTSG